MNRRTGSRTVWTAIVFVTVATLLCAALPACAVAAGAPQGKESGPGGARAADGAAHGGMIDINTADAEKLTDLPGVGRALAQRIVDYRKEHGPFKTVDELLNVRGIGEKSLARFRDRVTVEGRRGA